MCSVRAGFVRGLRVRVAVMGRTPSYLARLRLYVSIRTQAIVGPSGHSVKSSWTQFRKDGTMTIERGEPMPFAEKLRAFRLEKGWSQTELAEKAGLTRDGVAHLEQGRREPS